jgi:hypothetical protein
MQRIKREERQNDERLDKPEDRPQQPPDPHRNGAQGRSAP